MNVTTEDGPVCYEWEGPEIDVWSYHRSDFILLSSGKS